MLKDRYSFKYTPKQAIEIHDAIASKIINRKDSEKIDTGHGLAIAVLKKFCGKLRAHNYLEQSKPRTFSLNFTEALAIHFGYTSGAFDTNNIYIQEIFTAIDKTI